MRLHNRIFIAGFAIFLALAIFRNPLLVFIARRQLKTRLPGSTVVVSRCRINPLGKIYFSGIQLKKPFVYELRIKYLTVDFSLVSILKALGKDFAQAVEGCDLDLEYFQAGKIRIKDGFLKVRRSQDDGLIGCAELKYEKLDVRDIKGKAGLKGDYLRIDQLSGNLLGGIFKADSLIKLNALAEYQANLDFNGLDLGIFMKDFAFDEKAEVTGKLSGSLKLRADNQNILLLEGRFGSGKEGGLLTVKDLRFLQNMARSSGQALEIVVASFKNYRYNTGIISIGLENNNIVFLIDLEGGAGKRSLNITWHDFNFGRGK